MTSESIDKNKIDQTKISYLSQKYKLINEIGSGSFGEVYLAEENATNKFYAIKIEEKKKNSRLKDEYNIYKKLKDNGILSGIPKISNFIETTKYNIMVMQLLGKSLDCLLTEFDGKFDLQTVLKLGINIINLLRQIHDAGVIHRDIKPNNFLIGRDDDQELYIMDFGLSKQYIVKNEHIKMHIERSLVGTARYASINVHIGIEPSRRDDLESVGYMLIYFLKGRLPWQGLKKKEGIDQVKVIGNAKMYVSIKKLCENIPKCFLQYIEYCRNLQFDEIPDYDHLINLFKSCPSIDNNICDQLKYIWN